MPVDKVLFCASYNLGSFGQFCVSVEECLLFHVFTNRLGAVDKIVTITPDLTAMSNNSKRKNQSQNSQSERPGNQSKEVKLDPSKYFTVETSVKHLEASDLVEEGEELIAENQQRLTIAQAFASGDNTLLYNLW